MATTDQFGTIQRIGAERGSLTKRSTILVLACVLAFAVKLALSLTTYGTNDMLYREADLRKIQADGGLALYRDGAVPVWQGKQYRVEPNNQPPFMIHALRVWGQASALSGVPLRVWLRVTCAMADLGTIWLVWGILKAEKLTVRPRMMLLLALSPVAILVSGFHGNTDPIMVFFLLLSIYLIDTGHAAWLAGAALGMAMNIKVVPVIFLPAVLLCLPTMRRRIEFTVSAGMVFLAGSIPYLAQDPRLVIRSVFGYSPVNGVWGLPGLTYLVSVKMFAAYRIIGKPLVLCAVLLASVWAQVRAPKASLFLRCGLIAFLFLFLASGFGVQYLTWILPWWVVLSWRSVRWHYIATAAYITGFYTVWSHGGWSIANLLEYSPPPPGSALLFFLELACWISVGMVTLAYIRRIRAAAVAE